MISTAGTADQPTTSSKSAEYPEELLKKVFGKGTKGKESYGLKFTSCHTPELLDYENAELLFIAAHEGKEGLEISLGTGKGEGL